MMVSDGGHHLPGLGGQVHRVQRQPRPRGEGGVQTGGHTGGAGVTHHRAAPHQLKKKISPQKTVEL